MFKKLARWAAAISATLVALRIGYFQLGTTFRNYDDEGYVLLSIKHYMAGGHLYTQVFSQYGPVFYFVQSFLFHVFHQPLTHDGGRVITFILWLAASGAAACFTYRVTRSVLLAAVSGLTLMEMCSLLFVNEPNHPQHLILLLFMLACCASTVRRSLAFSLLGAIGAAIVFIKINIGVFFFAAVLATIVCMLRAGALRRIGGILFALYFLLGPIALTRRDLHTWALPYCTFVVLCGVFTYIAALSTSPKLLTVRATISYVVAGAVAISGVVLVGVALQGMTMQTLLDGILLTPLKQPNLFELPWEISWRMVFAAATLMCIIAAFYYRQRQAQRSVRWIALVRGFAVLYVAYIFIFHETHFPAGVALFLPLGLLPADASDWNLQTYLPRLFVTMLGATEMLESYPVASSQLIISAAPVVLWAFLCISDAARELGRRFPALTRPYAGLSLGALLGAVLLLCAEVQTLRPRLWRMRFAYPASALHGSAWLHLDPPTEQTYEAISSDISGNCDMLFTLPGMGSFNLWSQTDSPNGTFLTAWVKALRQDQQQEIRSILSNDPNSCVIVKPKNIWQVTDADLAASPLASYILTQMRPVSVIGEYQIRVNSHRTRAWVEAASPAQSVHPLRPV